MTKPDGRFFNAVCIIGVVMVTYLATQSTAQTFQSQPDSVKKWHRDAKFGMFLHWGLYSGPAKSEWDVYNSGTPLNTYWKYAYPPSNNPGDTAWFEADAYLKGNAGSDLRANWATLARKGGFKYMILTARHHDGFALFDSCHPNQFGVTNTLGKGKDLYKIYHDRCRQEGIRFGMYMSVMSWRYPGLFDVYGTGAKPNNWGIMTDPAHKENARLMKEEFYTQITYLMKKYSPVDYLFWDGGWLAHQGSDKDAAFFWEPDKYRSSSNEWQIDPKYAEYDSSVTPPKPLGVMGVCRKYSPNVLANPRLGWDPPADVNSIEYQAWDRGNIRTGQLWERDCNFNPGEWGYHPDRGSMDYSTLTKYLINAIVRDGNLLINFGPDRHGNIPQKYVDVILQMGKWLGKVHDAVYSTRGGPWQPSDDKYGFTYKPDKIFVHILDQYSGTSFTTSAISGGNSQVRECIDLNSRKSLSFTRNGDGGITINGIDRNTNPPDAVVGIYMGNAVVDTIIDTFAAPTPVSTSELPPPAGRMDVQKPSIKSIVTNRGEITVHFSSAEAVRASEISLFTMQGRIVQCPIRQNVADISIFTSGIQDGVYYMKIKGAGGFYTVSKVTIQKR